MDQQIHVGLHGLHGGSIAIPHHRRDHSRQILQSRRGSEEAVDQRRVDEIHGGQSLPQGWFTARASTVCLGDVDCTEASSERRVPVLLDLVCSAQRHEGDGGDVMEGHTDFRARQLQVDCHGHRYCNRASFRQLERSLRTPEQAKRDRERAAFWSSLILLGLGFVATVITWTITYQLWIRLDQIAGR